MNRTEYHKVFGHTTETANVEHRLDGEITLCLKTEYVAYFVGILWNMAVKSYALIALLVFRGIIRRPNEIHSSILFVQ